jgi:hypothetical protein
MIRMNCCTRAARSAPGLLVCFLVLTPAGAWGAAYQFTQVADVPSQEQAPFSWPAINNAGAVAFYSNVSGVGERIVRGSGAGPVEVIAGPGAGFDGLLSSFVSINDGGTVAFYGQRGTSIGIYTRTGPGAAPTFVAPSGGEFSVNNSGVVAYASPDGVFASDGGTPRLIAASGVAIYPQINSAGLVAFGDGSGILVGDGSGPARRLLDADNPFGFIDQLAINDRGEVVFRAQSGISKMGIYVADADGNVRTVADTSRGYVFLRNPSINNKGDVVFIGQTANDSMGLYTGPDPVADKVIESGDMLFGLRAVGFDAYADGINDSGAVAFTYESISDTDTRSGVAVARPIPEPGALAGVALAAVMLLRRRARVPAGRFERNLD